MLKNSTGLDFYYEENKNENISNDGVVDEETYQEYLKISTHPLLTSQRLFSIPGNPKLLDILTPLTTLKKKILSLPEAEQKVIITKHKAATSLMQKANSLRRKAYGIHTNHSFSTKNNEATTILDIRKTEILELYGRFFTSQEILKTLSQEYNLSVSLSTLEAFKTKYQEEITKIQEKHRKDYSNIRLGYKRSRLEELTWMYNKRKEIYERTGYGEDHKILQSTLEQIRKECEKDELKISFEGNINITETINVHFQNEMFQQLSVKDIVLGRLCAKFGINPKVMHHRMHKSFYAKFVGTVEAEEDLMTDEIIYPSQIVYDFNKIRHQNKAIKIEEAQIITDSKKEESENPPAEINKLKQQIMKALEERKTKANIILSHVERESKSKK